MAERKVGFPRHDENSPIASRKVDGITAESRRPRTQPEYPFLTQGNCYDWSAWNHIFNAIPVAANIVTETAVIPIQQETVESTADFFLRPSDKWSEHAGS